MELSEEEIKLASFFSYATKVLPSLVAVFNNSVSFVIDKKYLPLVIGKNGENIKKLEKKINKKIYVFCDSDDLEEFTKNLFSDIKILQMEINNIMEDKVVTVFIPLKDKKKVIGKERARINLMETLLKRKFNASLFVKTKVI
jgi:N utilization substance protein A